MAELKRKSFLVLECTGNYQSLRLLPSSAMVKTVTLYLKMKKRLFLQRDKEYKHQTLLSYLKSMHSWNSLLRMMKKESDKICLNRIRNRFVSKQRNIFHSIYSRKLNSCYELHLKEIPAEMLYTEKWNLFTQCGTLQLIYASYIYFREIRLWQMCIWRNDSLK